MRLLVIRHGQTDWNLQKKMQGSADIPLNGTGLEQAAQARNALSQREYDAIYCSPLTRAKQTASVVNGGSLSGVRIDQRLKERDYGEFEGTPKSSFDYDAFWAYGKDLKYRKAENVRDFFARVYSFLDDLRAAHPEETVLVVCHAGVLKAIECYCHGMLPDNRIGPFLPANASVCEYELD